MTGAAHYALGCELAALLGGKLRESTVNLWASGALSGARHAFVFDCPEMARRVALKMAAAVADREFMLPDGFVADAKMVAPGTADNGIRIEALTLAS